MNFNGNTEEARREDNPDRGYSIDDELFAIALAIPALFAAERYVDTEQRKASTPGRFARRERPLPVFDATSAARKINQPRRVRIMGKVEQIESAIKALSAAELEQLRAWFAEFDASKWDRQLERDVAAGRLGKLAERALAEHAAARTTPL
jgi:hypothetical protein